jgi:hypothetical protein
MERNCPHRGKPRREPTTSTSSGPIPARSNARRPISVIGSSIARARETHRNGCAGSANAASLQIAPMPPKWFASAMTARMYSNALAQQSSAECGMAVSSGRADKAIVSFECSLVCSVPDGAGTCRQCGHVKCVPGDPTNGRQLAQIGTAWSNLLFWALCGETGGGDLGRQVARICFLLRAVTGFLRG